MAVEMRWTGSGALVNQLGGVGYWYADGKLSERCWSADCQEVGDRASVGREESPVGEDWCGQDENWDGEV